MSDNIPKIVIVLIFLLIFTCFYFGIKNNNLFQKEIDSLEKILAHRELVTMTLLNRDEFLRYQLSKSNIRISALEQDRYIEIIHKWEPPPKGKG